MAPNLPDEDDEEDNDFSPDEMDLDSESDSDIDVVLEEDEEVSLARGVIIFRSGSRFGQRIRLMHRLLDVRCSAEAWEWLCIPRH